MDGRYEKLSLNVINGGVWLKYLLVGTLKFFQKTELNNFLFKYDEIVNFSDISNGDKIDDVWNQ